MEGLPRRARGTGLMPSPLAAFPGVAGAPASARGRKTREETMSTPIADAGLDPAEIAKRVDAVLAEPLYWFPVRHHSPTTARHLQAAIAAGKPKGVFIEGRV